MAKIVITIEDVTSGPCAGKTTWSMHISGDPEGPPHPSTPAETVALGIAGMLAIEPLATEVEA